MSTVTVPSLTTDASCAIPVQPVSRTPPVLVPVNSTVPGHAHWQVPLHRIPVAAFGHWLPGGSQSSPAVTMLLPQNGVCVGPGVGVCVLVAVGVGVAVLVGVGAGVAVFVGVGVGPVQVDES